MSDTEYNAPEFDPILDGQVEDVQGDTAETTGTETDYFNCTLQSDESNYETVNNKSNVNQITKFDLTIENL